MQDQRIYFFAAAQAEMNPRVAEWLVVAEWNQEIQTAITWTQKIASTTEYNIKTELSRFRSLLHRI